MTTVKDKKPKCIEHADGPKECALSLSDKQAKQDVWPKPGSLWVLSRNVCPPRYFVYSATPPKVGDRIMITEVLETSNDPSAMSRKLIYLTEDGKVNSLYNISIYEWQSYFGKVSQ